MITLMYQLCVRMGYYLQVKNNRIILLQGNVWAYKTSLMDFGTVLTISVFFVFFINNKNLHYTFYPSINKIL
jgi:hypothetical protein